MNAGIRSHWDHPNPPEDAWSQTLKSGAEAKQCLSLKSEYHLLAGCSVHRKS